MTEKQFFTLMIAVFAAIVVGGFVDALGGGPVIGVPIQVGVMLLVIGLGGR